MYNELRDTNGLNLQEFLEKYKTKQYPKPYLTADCLILSKKYNKTYILLVKRKNHPFINQWAIPGGFAQESEELSQTAQRELLEETSLQTKISLLDIYSEENRDPRGWVVSIAYYGFVDKDQTKIKAGDDAKQTKWFEIQINNQAITLTSDNITIQFDTKGNYLTSEKLAFDHHKMITDILQKFNIAV